MTCAPMVLMREMLSGVAIRSIFHKLPHLRRKGDSNGMIAMQQLRAGSFCYRTLEGDPMVAFF